MELALYNSVLSGVSLDGERIFYVNPHAYFPAGYQFDPRGPRIVGVRPEWHGCACCPSNLARLLSSLGGYLYGVDGDRLYLHLYASSTVDCTWGGTASQLTVTTQYPFDEEIRIRVDQAPTTAAKLCLRLPGWAHFHGVSINGKETSGVVKDGYLILDRAWAPGDEIELSLPMPIEMIEAHPAVRQDTGRVALKRGPLVYCLEAADNGPDLNQLHLSKQPFFTTERREIAGLSVPIVNASGLRDLVGIWGDDLYRATGQAHSESVQLVAIPYFMWANRGEGEMLIWLRHG